MNKTTNLYDTIAIISLIIGIIYLVNTFLVLQEDFNFNQVILGVSIFSAALFFHTISSIMKILIDIRDSLKKEDKPIQL